ncbi:PREDICTED: cell division control protein 6 homolog [Brassica oleracea var. oleracea]|uniref:cell division control protein 6 homolog n=1 Tax=Brassica oleracea var. oleracea TaxID=109376 RepID=UPI0006A733FB|nr:PREDICTED: cell division control protein 6 homolog [Brassica oleracea var. oleracea]
MRGERGSVFSFRHFSFSKRLHFRIGGDQRRRLASQHSSKAEAEIRFRRGGCSNRGLDAMKWKSHRRCVVSSPRTPITEVEKESNGKLFDCLDVKSKWNPRDDDQMKAVKEALHVSKAPSTAGSLYICGCLGTGKSLSMEKVRQQTQDWAKQEGLPCLETVSVNCTSLTKTIDIFSKILGENETGKKAVASSSPLQQLQIMFSQKQQSPSSKMM